jgi:hypothetical protein
VGYVGSVDLDLILITPAPFGLWTWHAAHHDPCVSIAILYQDGGAPGSSNIKIIVLRSAEGLYMAQLKIEPVHSRSACASSAIKGPKGGWW